MREKETGVRVICGAEEKEGTMTRGKGKQVR